MRKFLILLALILLAFAAARTEFGQKQISLIEKLIGSSPTALPGMANLTNRVDGYTILYPEGMKTDSALAPLVTILSNEQAQVEIFHEKFSGIDAEEYITYNTMPLEDGRDPVNLIKTGHSYINGLKVYQTWWQRKTLKHVANDKNFYAVVGIKISAREAYSLHFKTNDPQWLEQNVGRMVRSFRIKSADQDAVWQIKQAKERRYSLKKSTEAFFRNELLPKQQWGIFEPGAPLDKATLLELENKLTYKFKFLLAYSKMDSPPPLAELEQAGEEGRILEYTLQTLLHDRPANYPMMYDLLDGKYDETLRGIARDMARYGKPVLFRLNNEMNGDWCGYSAYYNSLDPDLYRELWRYLYELFYQEGADNVLWIWNPHDRSFPNFKWNHALMYYPGDEYVDIIGLTGYNTGTYYPAEKWRSFNDIYQPLYREYEAYFPDKPFVITEFASSSIGGDKAAWIRDAFSRLKGYSRIKLAFWWNHIDYDGETKARIYRLEDDGSLAAFKEGLKEYR